MTWEGYDIATTLQDTGDVNEQSLIDWARIQSALQVKKFDKAGLQKGLVVASIILLCKKKLK